MFQNEVPVKAKDKERLQELLAEAHTILEKYPFQNIEKQACTVTIISRAKTSVREAMEHCSLLYTESEGEIK